MLDRLPHSTFLDLTTQDPDAPDDAWEEEITVGTHEAHEIRAVCSSFWAQRQNATSRLGTDLVPPSRPVRADEMPMQEYETTHAPCTRPSASESIPPDVPVVSVERGDSVQAMSTRRITFKRPPNPLKHSILARSMFVLHGRRLCREITVVFVAAIAIWMSDILLYLFRIRKLEIDGT